MHELLTESKGALEARRKELIEKISFISLNQPKNKGSIIYYSSLEKKARLALFKAKYGLVGEKDTKENFDKLIKEGKGFVEFKSCVNKVAYVNMKALKKACFETSLRTGRRQYGYYCEFCDLFHSTTHPNPNLENIAF